MFWYNYRIPCCNVYVLLHKAGSRRCGSRRSGEAFLVRELSPGANPLSTRGVRGRAGGSGGGDSGSSS